MLKIVIQCTYANGNKITTNFNGTLAEAVKYYTKKLINIGAVNDNIQKCTDVELLNVIYNDKELTDLNTLGYSSLKDFITENFVTNHFALDLMDAVDNRDEELICECLIEIVRREYQWDEIKLYEKGYFISSMICY